MLWYCRSQQSNWNNLKPDPHPLQAQIIALQLKLQAHESRHDAEMQWRIAEEKCANELLQTQLNEIQVTFISISICGMEPVQEFY